MVLVVRDLHRHAWMGHAVARLLAARPDAIVVELGVPALVTGAVHVATYGATRAGCVGCDGAAHRSVPIGRLRSR